MVIEYVSAVWLFVSSCVYGIFYERLDFHPKSLSDL